MILISTMHNLMQRLHSSNCFLRIRTRPMQTRRSLVLRVTWTVTQAWPFEVAKDPAYLDEMQSNERRYGILTSIYSSPHGPNPGSRQGCWLQSRRGQPTSCIQGCADRACITLLPVRWREVVPLSTLKFPAVCMTVNSSKPPENEDPCRQFTACTSVSALK